MAYVATQRVMTKEVLSSKDLGQVVNDGKGLYDKSCHSEACYSACVHGINFTARFQTISRS